MNAVKFLADPSTVDATELPTYKDCIQRIYQGIRFYYENNNNYDVYPYSPGGLWLELKDFGVITSFDISVTMAAAVVWTLVRYLTTWTVFSPFSKSLKMKAVETMKMPESMWKLVVYSIMWSYCSYILFGCGQYNDIFHETPTIWRDWEKGMDVGRYVYILYAAQFSFYIHSVYGTLFMDEWRKDSLVMIFHHLLTMALIGFSYGMRYHKLGVLVLYLHDITDIMLEFTKCNVYLKNRNGKYHPLNDHLSTIGFTGFAGTWFVFRLYWYPLKVLYAVCYGSMIFSPTGSESICYFFFSGMLMILQGLNLYWFKFILVFLFNILTGRMSEVEDVRELEADEPNKANGICNGGADFTHRRSTSTTNKGKKRD